MTSETETVPETPAQPETPTPEVEALAQPETPAQPKRFAMFTGQGSDFSWGKYQFIRKGTVIEVDRYDSKLKLALAYDGPQKQWVEVDPEVIDDLWYCDYCLTYHEPERMKTHLQDVHQKLIGPEIGQLHDTQTRRKLIDIALKALKTEDNRLKAEQDKIREYIHKHGIRADGFNPDKSISVEVFANWQSPRTKAVIQNSLGKFGFVDDK